MESFGIQEKANSKIYTDSNASMMAGGEKINSGSNKFNPGSINKAL
jgi:hypothetical protein